MPVEQIVIEVSSDSKQLDSLLNKLVKAGQLSKQQADQFRGDSQKFEDASKKRTKLLDDEIKDLTELKLRKQQAFSVKEIEEYNRRIKESESRIKALGGEAKRTQDTFRSFNKITSNLVATIAAAFTIQRIVAFTDRATDLAAELQGVEKAFRRLNQPNLLADLRKATRDTVSDLELMRLAVKAENFKVPLEQLATFFQFATQRSIETGDSVDDLVNSIVNGIGRKSALVIDNLGIPVAEVQKEFKKTGDFATAVANIINREMSDASGTMEDTAKVVDEQLSAAFENLSAIIGQKLTPATMSLKEGLIAVLKATGLLLKADLSALDYVKLFTDRTEAAKVLSKAVMDVAKQDEQAQKQAEKNNNTVKEQILTMEEFIELHKDEFEAFDKKVKALNEEDKLMEALNDELRTYIELQRQGAIASIFALIEEKNRLIQNLDELDKDAQERDEAEAERFDEFQKDLKNKKDKFAKEDKDRMLSVLQTEYEISQARVDLAQSIVGAFANLAGEAAKGQQALLAFEKLISIISIIINLQREIAINGATLPPIARDAANIQSRLRAATGIATVLSTAIPQFKGFKKGVIDLQGPGTSTSDSIMARLSKGESVMTAAETSKYKKEFKAMREKKYEDYIFRNYQLPILKSYQNLNNEFNDQNIVHSLYKLRKGQDQLIAVVKQNKQHQLSTR